jgi:hypothetical protein
MRKRTLAAVLSTGLVAGLVVGIPMTVANAAGSKAASPTVQIRQSDFISGLSDTRSAGHFTFIKDGLHLLTDDATSNAKVAEYFPVSGSLADMVGSSIEWWGTDPAPGSQIVFDTGIPGANRYNILVGEAVYKGDWWLTNGSSAEAKAASPLPPGGSGSDWHGTLAEWAAALPDATVYAGGFSLGSGVKGDGLLYSETFGTTEYHFTNVPAVKTSTMTISPKAVVFGKAVIATGSLKSDGVGVSGAVVTLQRQSGASWVYVGSTKSDANGNWSKSIIPPSTWTIRATAAGYPSPSAVLTVSSKVAVRATGRTIYVAVAPNLAGKRVVLQIQSGKSWLNVASATLTKNSTAALKATKAGVYHVVALAVPGYATGVSASVSVK